MFKVGDRIRVNTTRGLITQYQGALGCIRRINDYKGVNGNDGQYYSITFDLWSNIEASVYAFYDEDLLPGCNGIERAKKCLEEKNSK